MDKGKLIKDIMENVKDPACGSGHQRQGIFKNTRKLQYHKKSGNAVPLFSALNNPPAVNYFTAAFNDLPAVNLGTFFAAIFIGSPVCGFLPFRADLFVTEKVPKPTRVTLSPRFRAFVTAVTMSQ